MEYILLVALVLLYLRYLSPIVVRWQRTSETATLPVRVTGRANSFLLFASEEVQIPSDQWRLVPTGVTFRPFPGITLKSVDYRVSFFGQVDYSLEAIASARGRRVLGRLSPAGSDAVVLHNHNQKYTVRLKAGDPVAIITFYRTPFVFLRQA